jgi:hypothetical protein
LGHIEQGLQLVSDQFLRADREQSHGVVLGERVQFARCAFDLSDDDRDVFVGFDLLHVIYDLNKTHFFYICLRGSLMGDI